MWGLYGVLLKRGVDGEVMNMIEVKRECMSEVGYVIEMWGGEGVLGFGKGGERGLRR